MKRLNGVLIGLMVFSISLLFVTTSLYAQTGAVKTISAELKSSLYYLGGRLFQPAHYELESEEDFYDMYQEELSGFSFQYFNQNSLRLNGTSRLLPPPSRALFRKASKDNLKNGFFTLDPWRSGLNLDPTYRGAKYADYNDDGWVDAIVGEEGVICEIKVEANEHSATAYDINDDGVVDMIDAEAFKQGLEDENSGDDLPDINGDGFITVYDLTLYLGTVFTTTLTYIEHDGFPVVVNLPGVIGPNIHPDLLLGSASVREGVYFGIGSVITKVYNFYNNNGDRIFGAMKRTFFDSQGGIYRTELSREVSRYNRNGGLTTRSTVFQVDGRTQWLETLHRVYIHNSLFMETKNKLWYDDNGIISSSTTERTRYGKYGEVRYTSDEYIDGRKVRSTSRTTEYDSETGEAIHKITTTHYYDNDGNTTSVYTDEEIWATVIEDGKEYDIYERTDRWESGGYWNRNVVKQKTDSNGNIVYDFHRSESSNGYAYESEINVRVNEETGGYFSSTLSTNWDRDGNIVYRNYREEEETYEDGRLFTRRRFIRNQRRFRGELITAYESENVEEFKYDDDGDVVNIHEYGYWFTNYVDPYSDKNTSFLYKIIDNIKRLVEKHIFHIVAEDKDFKQTTYRYTEDTAYDYQSGGAFLSVSTHIYEERVSPEDQNKVYFQREVFTQEEYYDETLKEYTTYTEEYENGELSYIKVGTGSVDPLDGSWIKTTHEEWYGKYLPSLRDTTEIYDAQGRLMLREETRYSDWGKQYYHLEQFTYHENGRLASREILSEGYWHNAIILKRFEEPLKKYPGLSGGPNNHYYLLEKFDKDGDIVYRKKENDNNGWPYLIGYIENTTDGYRPDTESRNKEDQFIWPPYWGGYSSSELEESWEYVSNKNGKKILTQYERKSSGKKNWIWWRPNDWKEEVSLGFNPETGNIEKETYYTSGSPSLYRWLRLEHKKVDKLDVYYAIKRIDLIPKDVAEFLKGAVSDFYASSQPGLEQHMEIQYAYDDAGRLVSTSIEWTANRSNGNGDTAYVFFCELTVDPETGKIAQIVSTKSPDLIGKAPILFVNDQPFKMDKETTSDNKPRRVDVEDEVAARLDMLIEKTAEREGLPQDVTLHPEMATAGAQTDSRKVTR